jgi:amino acid transporter
VLWNLFGAKAVGESSMVVGVLLLSPFVLVTAFALTRHVTLAPVAATKGDLLTGLLVAMWNYMGWDNASTVANDVENPQKTYPRVMIITLVAIVLSYIVPIAAVWHTNLSPSVWGNGSWFNIASTVASPWLGSALVMAAMVSTFGSLNSLVMSYSRLPVAMAEDGLLPAIFHRKLEIGAPWVSLVVLAAAWSASLGLNFDRLIMLDILLYGASLVLEFVALVTLRIREPQLPRPFRIPGGLPTAVLVGVGPTALLVIAFLKNRDARIGNVSALSVAMALMAAGVMVYCLQAWLRRALTQEQNS